MLLNSVVFRLRTRGGVSVRVHLAKCAGVLGAVANQDLRSWEIVAAAIPRSFGEPSRRPSPPTRAAPGPRPARPPGLPRAGLPNSSAKFDWNVIVLSQPGRSGGSERITVSGVFATSPKATMERADQFLAAIASLLEDFADSVEVSISDEAERGSCSRPRRAPRRHPARPGSRRVSPGRFPARSSSRWDAKPFDLRRCADRPGGSRGFCATRGGRKSRWRFSSRAGPARSRRCWESSRRGGLRHAPKDPPAQLARLIEEAAPVRHRRLSCRENLRARRK
jgi:hypothetical protein